MAFSMRRSLASSLSHRLARRLHPAASHLLPSHHDHPGHPPSPAQPPPFPAALRRPTTSQLLTLPVPFGLHLSARRGFSTSPVPAPESTAEIDAAAGVLSDAASSLPSVPAPFPGEVAAAAADSFPTVAALQHLIDAVQSFTGLNWWVCIALTTVLIRTVTIPLMVNQMKSTIKLNELRPEIEKISVVMQNSTDPRSMLEGKQKLGELFIKNGVNPLTPLKSLFIQGPIFMSFFFAISNMVEKVPSLKGGGAYWFTDLTTPDELFILPVLTSLTFLASVELNMQDGMEGNPMLQTMKNFSRVMAVLTVPFTMSFPKAIFFYWVTSNFFSLGYGFALRKPAVRNYLGLPPIETESRPAHVPALNLFGGPKSMAPLEIKESVLSRQLRDLEMKAKSRGEPHE